ncbi:helix-turn-helix domain-containing protein [Mycolicibacterium sp. HK-90]|uniref:helix-turn-helix domain-containing protein n=1 Tax=Mycolicibacterium sp. HK-90 TaxID=3056937 RepID=UPI00265AC51D|nr:helix-turn-helix transcriptional regulator [Mycolicibacterium sp. HK-90]WKG04303.1 helix-turn-helix transcriptional regulator [Mycolicibacterium sp. HK-90]
MTQANERTFLSRQVLAFDDMRFAFVTESVETPTDWQFSDPEHILVVHRAGDLATMEVEFERGPSGPALPRVGDLWIIPAEQRYAALAQGRSVAFCEVRTPTHLFGDHDIAPTVRHHDPLLLHLINRMHSVVGRKDALARLLSESLADVFRRRIAADFLRRGGRDRIWDQASQAKVVEYLEDNLDSDISLSGLADHMGVTRDQLARTFRDTFHTSPHQYLLDRRIRRAKQLLVHTSRSIAEISKDAGFSTPSHFATTFRARTGTTPSQYRKNG